MKSLALLAVTGATVLGHSNTKAEISYHKLASYQIGGEGGWDYLIVGPGHRVFISRGSHVEVIDGTSGKILGDIPETLGVHGIAFSAKLNRGFTSNGRENTVTEFDLTTYKVIRKIPVSGQNPDCIVFDPKTNEVITCNGRSGDVSVIDPLQGKEVGKISIGGKLEFAAVDSTGTVFVNNESKNEVEEVNPASMKLVKSWSIAPAEGPSGLAMDIANHRLFSVTDGKMVISDSNSGKVFTVVNIGQGPDAAAFDPKLKLAFSSNGETGTLSVVKELTPSKFQVQQTVETQPGARTMALDPLTHKIYLVCANMTGEPNAQGRRQMVPGSFTVLVYGPKN